MPYRAPAAQLSKSLLHYPFLKGEAVLPFQHCSHSVVFIHHLTPGASACTPSTSVGIEQQNTSSTLSQTIHPFHPYDPRSTVVVQVPRLIDAQNSIGRQPTTCLRQSKTMAAAQRAIPSHLRDGSSTNGESASAFKRNHHGKSQSHVVSLECCENCSSRDPTRDILFWASTKRRLACFEVVREPRSQEVVIFVPRNIWKELFGDRQIQTTASLLCNTIILTP